MKIMLIGASAAGKTTLIQRLYDEEIKYDKTQAIEYVGNFIDTPGEYMQARGYWGPLTIASHDADLVGFVQDSSSEDCWFSPGCRWKFQKPVIGIITKIDLENSNQALARSYLKYAGCDEIFAISSVTGEGVERLSANFHKMVDKYKVDHAFQYEDDYFD